MKIHTTLKLIAISPLFIWANAAFSQHFAPEHGTGHGQGITTSPYAGQQTRAIKSLSPTQTDDLLAGKGMELAKAAELNGYPGPVHTLELSPQLGLSPQQQQATQTLLNSHKAEARTLGAQLVNAERQLDQAFSSRQIDADKLSAHTRRIGELQAALRAAHLQTHLQQTALLTPEQIGRYAELRGYMGAAGTAPASTPASVHRH